MDSHARSEMASTHYKPMHMMFLGVVCGGLRGGEGRSLISMWFLYVPSSREGSSALGFESCYRYNNCVVSAGEGIMAHQGREE